MTSEKSEEKEKKMFRLTSDIPALDDENRNLFKAAEVLERMGNGPGLTADQFYKQLALSELPTEEFQAVTMAAIAIETMMNLDTIEDPFIEPTVH
jgi:hypothetical protein